MKKSVVMLTAILMLACLSAPAWAFGPGWQDGNRHGYAGRIRPVPAYYMPRGYHRPPPPRVVYYSPVEVVQPVVYAVPGPCISINAPGFSMKLR